MAAGAGLAGVLVVFFVAAQALVHAHRSPVIAGTDLSGSEGGMALIAQRPPALRAHFHDALPVIDDRERQLFRPDVHPGAAVEKAEGRSVQFFFCRDPAQFRFIQNPPLPAGSSAGTREGSCGDRCLEKPPSIHIP
jgi:hypothetical protein